MSKKKKIILIVFCVIFVLIAAIIAGGIYALNWYCKTPDYTVYQTADDVQLVAHRGFRAIAPENTAPAFEEAGKAGFYGAECDVYRTKDGVWVVNHDSTTYRMMDGSEFIEKITYEELMKQTIDNGSDYEKYGDTKICTLKEYLDICQKYNMVPVIELKGKNNTEHYDEIVNMLGDYADLKPLFISFHLENLQKIRALSDAPCWYLVQKITDEEIEKALSIGGECGIDFNYSKEENTDEMVMKCVNTGMAVGAWTVNDPEAVTRLANLGVIYITTDCITY